MLLCFYPFYVEVEYTLISWNGKYLNYFLCNNNLKYPNDILIKLTNSLYFFN